MLPLNTASVKYSDYETVVIDGVENVVIDGQLYAMRKSKFCMNYSPVIVSDYMSGKMEGIPSISSSVLLNARCQARRKIAGAICEHCFADALLNARSNVAANMEKNFNLLHDHVLPLELLPRFGNVQIARIESFGDVSSVEHAINYANTIKVNPFVIFAWWTKNVDLVEKALDAIGGKPDNLILIQSSLMINQKEEKKSHYVDKVFTVYNDEYLSQMEECKILLDAVADLRKTDRKAYNQAVANIYESIFVNCGGRSCMNCRKCYNKATASVDVNERLK